MDNGLILILISLCFMAVLLFIFEKSRLSAKEISLIAVLAAVSAIGRIIFMAIPGVEVTTFLVILTGVTFGPLAGFLTGIFSVLISNIFLGHGPWTVFQMLAWGLCGVTSGYLGHYIKNHKIILSIFAFMWGFLFGWINNLWHWLAFIEPLSFRSWLAVNATSLSFDIIRSVFNFMFMYLMGSDFIKILVRFSKKLKHSYKRIN